MISTKPFTFLVIHTWQSFANDVSVACVATIKSSEMGTRLAFIITPVFVAPMQLILILVLAISVIEQSFYQL